MNHHSQFSDSLRFNFINMKLADLFFLSFRSMVLENWLICQFNGFIQRKFHQEMAPPPTDLSHLVLKFMYEHKLYETAQSLEQESKVYFNLEDFKGMIRNGLWEKVHMYLRSFIRPDDSSVSKEIFSKIGTQEYLEALDMKDEGKKAAFSVYEKVIKPLKLTPECTWELMGLITLENFREKREYADYGDTKTMRAQLVVELVKILGDHPKIKGILSFPPMDDARLETLVKQSTYWQNCICHKTAATRGESVTLFADHVCKPSVNPDQSAEAQMLRRDPYRRDQNGGAGPSTAPHLRGRNFNHFNFRRP